MTLLERVARALCTNPDYEGPVLTGEYPPYPKNWQRKLPDARAALEAIPLQPLVEAMDQLLNDMGPDGLCVCGAAKAQARIAFEPFIDPALRKDYDDYYMTLEAAQKIDAALSEKP